MMGLSCTATLLCMAFSPFCPIGSLLIWAQNHIKAPGPHLHRNYKDGLETKCENYCGCWQLVLIACACLSAPIFYLLPALVKRRETTESCISLHKYRSFWFLSSGSYYVLDAEFLLCKFITCMLSLLRGTEKAAVSNAVLKIVSNCFLSRQRDVI